MTPKGISLVVCCHNSALRMPQTIKYIASQQVGEHIMWEVIIVDNACTDNTAEIARSEWEKYGNTVPFRVIEEPAAGLSHARIKGFQSARYGFILFCDDDNWLDNKYIETAFDILSEHENIGVLGGLGTPVFEVGPPEWLDQLSLFAVGPQAPSPGKVKENVVYGAGFVIRKSAYEKLLAANFKSLLPDRVSSTLSSGGDYELCYLIVLAGYEVWYDDRLKFWHFLPESRLNWEYYEQFVQESYQCFEVLEPYKILLSRTSSPGHWYFLFSIFRMTVYFIRRIIPVTFKLWLLRSDSLRGKANKIEFKRYRNRLKLYFLKYRTMKKNYQEGKRLKKALDLGGPVRGNSVSTILKDYSSGQSIR